MSTQPSDRVMLARLAASVIAASDGVSATSGPAGRWASPDGSQVIEGVVAAHDGGGRIELQLHLVVDWPPDPIEVLASRLRERVRRAADNAGLAPRLGAVGIAVEAIHVPGEEIV